MALRLRRGTDAERLLITPIEGELVYTTDTKLLYVGDGTTAGGTLVTGAGGGGSTTLDALTDTDLTGAANSDVLTFNASTNKWEAVAVPGVGILDLNSIDGIAITGEVQYNQILAWDGVNFGPRYADEVIPAGIDLNVNILGNDSSIIVDTDTNTFTGNFVGDGSLLTNLPVSGGGDPISLNSLTDVAITEIPAFNQILAWDGSNFSPRYADEVIPAGIDLNINIVGDDSTIIVDTDTNTVTGNFVGDLNGNIVGDVRGSVFGDDSTVVIDGITGDVSANDLSIGGGGILFVKDGNSLGISSALNNGRIDVATINTNVFSVIGDLGSTEGASLTTSTSRGTSAAPIGLQAGDFSGAVTFSAYKTSLSDYRVNAGILSSVDTVTGTDDIPGKISVALRDPDGDIFFPLSVNSRGVTEAPIFKPTAYADTTARDAAITSPEAGMVIFVTDSDGGGTEALQVYKATGGWTTIS